MTQKWHAPWLAITLCLCGTSMLAQERTLSIDDLFTLAEQNSIEIKQQQSAEQEAQLGVKAAKADRLPDVATSLSVSYIGNGFTSDHDWSNIRHQSLPHFGQNFALEASQAVYTGGAITAGISLAELGQQMAAVQTEQSRQQVRFMLLGHYLNLYKLQNQARVYTENIQLTKQLIEHVEHRQQQGTALKNDITRQELHLEQLRLALTSVQSNIGILNFQLCNTLGLPHTTQIQPDTTILAQLFARDGEAHWQQQASAHSVALQQADLGVKMAEQKVKLEQSALRPKVAIVAQDHLDGPNLYNVPAIDGNFNWWFVGVGIKYDLHSLWKSKKSVAKSRQALQTAYEQQAVAREGIENAVQASYADYIQSYQDLRTQTKNVELSTQNYNVVSNRYQNDLALITDMVDAQNTKLNAELQAANARIGIIYAYYKMKFVSGTL